MLNDLLCKQTACLEVDRPLKRAARVALPALGLFANRRGDVAQPRGGVRGNSRERPISPSIAASQHAFTPATSKCLAQGNKSAVWDSD
jgi:hypothetical protein